MSIFSFFKKPKDTTVVEMAQQVAATPITEPTQEIAPTTESNPAKTDKIVTIHYGTGMAIDSIYAFISKDYEQDGYDDALVNCAAEYCKAKENIILNTLQQLFNQVLLRYRNDIRLLDVQIENARALFSLNYASILEAKKGTCEEHIEEINTMKKKLEAKAPEMMTMIESYRRGFSKGCVAQTTNFLNNHPSEIY